MKRTVTFTMVQVVLGGVLVAVPTLFTVFAFEFTSLSVWIKALVVVAWVGIALLLVWRGVEHDQSLDASLATITEVVAHQREQIRAAAQGRIFDTLLEPGTLFPKSYNFIAYLYDKTDDVLRPVWPRGMSDATERTISFEPGNGATGLSWQENALVVVTGEEVYNDVHHLTPEQQRHWKGYRAVASTPIWSDTQVRLGVLTGISRIDDQYFEEPAGQALLREVASTLGVVLRAVLPAS